MILCANPLENYKAHRDKISDAIKRALESGAYILGQEVESFEKSFASFCGARFCVGVANGTDAICLALKSSGIKPGDEVITVSHTALATIAGIVQAGATPVLVDVNPDDLTLNVNLIESVLSAKTRAIVAVHLYGQPVEMGVILEIAQKHNLVIIEDCAQSHGAKWNGRTVGSIGDVSAFSFYPTKNLGAFGDGGSVVTSNEAVYNDLKKRRQYGWNHQRFSEIDGVNSRLDELQAAILNEKLKLLKDDNSKRQKIGEMYRQGLLNTFFQPMICRKNTEPVYHLFVVKVDLSKRDLFIQKMKNHGIHCGIHYAQAAHQQEGFIQKCRVPLPLTETENAVRSIVSLPMYPELCLKDVEKIILTSNEVSKSL